MDESKQSAEPTPWEMHEGLYSSVGQAISFWASMEGKIVQIAAKLLETTDEKAGLVLYSIMNFFAWLPITDELFGLEPRYNSVKDDWGQASNKLRALNDIRVRLAHHTIWDHPDQDLALRPGRFDARAKSKKHAPLTDLEIATFTGELIKVEDQLEAILKAMSGLEIKPFSSLLGTLFEPSRDPPPPADAPQHNSDKAP
jgi:hypothetical protein